MTTPNQPLVQLAIQSKDTTDAAFDALLPEVAKLLGQVANPQTAMGVVQALLRLATSIAYATIGTPVDITMRSAEDAAALAAAHWKAATHLNALVLAELKRQGFKVPSELQRSVNAAPPDGDAQEAAEAASMPDPVQHAQKLAAVVSGSDSSETPESVALGDQLMKINARGGAS
jgi:hypothetical protein